MYVGVSPLFSSGTTSSTTNTDRNSSSLLWNNPLPLPSPVQKENVQMLFTLRVLAVIYIYPVLYTSSSCSPLCHQGKCFFFFYLCCADEENGDDRDSPRQWWGQEAECGSFWSTWEVQSTNRSSSWPLCLFSVRDGIHPSISMPPLKPCPNLHLHGAFWSCRILERWWTTPSGSKSSTGL